MFRHQSHEYALADSHFLLGANCMTGAISTLCRSDVMLRREMMDVAARPSVVRAVTLMARTAAAVALTGLLPLFFIGYLAGSILLDE